MAARTSSSLAIFLVLNILLFTITTACGTCPEPTPNPAVIPPTKCPKDTLKLGACADVLGLINVVLGSPAVTPCCSLLSGLADLEAAVCLCTALKANILGINLNVPISLSLLLNVCSKEAPADFIC